MQHRTLTLTVLALFSWFGQNALCQAPGVKITSYDIKTSLNLVSRELQVSAEVELVKADSVAVFQMMLNSGANIGSVRCTVQDAQVDLSHRFLGQDTLLLTLPPELAASRNLTLNFYYSLPVSDSKAQVIVLDRGNRWYPLILDQIARFKLTASVPLGYTVFAPGDLVEKKDFGNHSQFVWQSKIPVFKLSFITAKSDFYKETSIQCDSSVIAFYSPGGDKESIERILAEACSAFKFYSQSIGEYHDNSLTLVEVPGMGGTNISTGLLMVDSTFIGEFKNGNSDMLLLPIACQWMAAGVFFEFLGKEFWFLQLSLPHYLRLRYLEKTKGELAFVQEMQRGLDAYKKIAGSEKEVSIMDVDFPNTREKATAIYGKGPYVFDKVRRQIGDDNWDKLIQDIYKDFKGKILTYDEFIKYLSRYDQNGAAVAKLNKMVTEKGVPGD
ncbi:MAG: hypothetical protein WCE90_09430 [Candidatus Zixiibacteriota bacterium]